MTDAISSRGRKRRNPLACPEIFVRTYSGRYICCHGIMRPRSSIYSVCCGPHDYDYRSHMCCADRVVYKPGGLPKCCGMQSYNAQSHMCYGGTVLPRKPTCRNQAYDPRECICCNGVIRRKPARNPACCGTRAYDSGECLCCGGVIWRKPPGNPKCCGTQAYNAQRYICRSDGRIQPLRRTHGGSIDIP